MATLANFKSALQYGGARPSLFQLVVNRPTTITAASALDDLKLFCNVSAIPPLTVTPIEKQYFGRTVKIPGDIVYGDLSTTIMNAEDYSIRNAIEVWMENINSHEGNKQTSSTHADWVGTARLSQGTKEGSFVTFFDFIDIWPTTLAEIPLSYDTASDIEQFDVTWAYNYYDTIGVAPAGDFWHS